MACAHTRMGVGEGILAFPNHEGVRVESQKSAQRVGRLERQRGIEPQPQRYFFASNFRKIRFNLREQISIPSFALCGQSRNAKALWLSGICCERMMETVKKKGRLSFGLSTVGQRDVYVWGLLIWKNRSTSPTAQPNPPFALSNLLRWGILDGARETNSLAENTRLQGGARGAR
eukprot:2357501-Rhodomonas_salina.1